MKPDQLVFPDETGVTTNMARLRGRCAGGERLIGKVPHGYCNITTFFAGSRCDELIAPMVTDGAVNGEIFLAYIEQFLVPVLRRRRES